MFGIGEYNFEDMFKPEDEATVKAKKQEAKQALIEAIEAGKTALNTKEFAIYRKKLEKAQSEIVNSMIVYTNDFFGKGTGDMALYGAYMARFMVRISTLRSLLSQVEKDANKEVLSEE